MKRILLLFGMGILLSSCNSSSEKKEEKPETDTVATQITPAEPVANKLSEQEKAEEWQLLFDGSTKNGWHVYQAKSDGSAWKVADGTLYLDPKEKDDFQTVGGGDLLSDSAFENFHLSLEWKIAPKGNSGLMFVVQEDKKYEHTFHTAPEMQVLDNAGHPDAKIAKHQAGDLYDIISSSKQAAKPAGEWNKAEIRLNNGKLDLFLNGENVVSTTMWDANWKKLVAGSKFKEWPAFATFKKGQVAIQDHGDAVWYRNIKIRKL